jgi:hypothetical protein
VLQGAKRDFKEISRLQLGPGSIEAPWHDYKEIKSSKYFALLCTAVAGLSVLLKRHRGIEVKGHI